MTPIKCGWLYQSGSNLRAWCKRNLVDREPVHGRPYHFQRSWIKNDLRADPANLRVMHVEGDSMMPTLHDGDIVLVDRGWRAPTPPGIFVLHDRMGLVAKRLEHIRRGFASSRTTLSTSPTTAAGTR